MLVSQIRIINKHGCHLPYTRSFERGTIALAGLVSRPVSPVPHSPLLPGVVIAEAGAVLFSKYFGVTGIGEWKCEKLLQACTIYDRFERFRDATHFLFRSARSRACIER